MSARNQSVFKQILSVAQLLLFFWLSVAPTLGQQTQANQQVQPDIRDLPIGVPVERKLTQQEVHLYGIELKQGEVVRVNFKEKGVDVGAVFVRVPDEQKVSAASNQGTGFMRESVTLIAPQDGWYALAVRAEPVTDPKVSATYELLATRDVKASNSDSQRARAELLLEEGSRAQQSSDQQSLASAKEKGMEAHTIWRSLGEEYWEGISEVLIGSSGIYSEKPVEGVAPLKDALRIFQGLNDQPAIAHVSLALATLYITMKDHEQASAFLNQSLSIARKLGDKRIESLSAMINSSNVLGDVEKPLSNNYAEEVSRARARNDKHAEALIWANHVLRNSLDDEMLEDEERDTLFARAEREALPLLRTLKERDLELHVLLGLGVGLYDEEAEDPSVNQRSLNYVCQALVLAQIQNNRMMQAYAYLQLNVFYSSDNDPLAILFGKKALDVIQEMRSELRIGDKETQQAVAKYLEDGSADLASDLIGEGRFAEAVQILNQVRDQEFFDFKLVRSPEAKLTLTPREAKSSAAFDAAIVQAAAKYANVDGQHFEAAGREIKSLLGRIEQTFAGPKEVAENVPDAVELQSAMRDLSAVTRQKHVALYLDGDIDDVLLITPEGIKGFTRQISLFALSEWNEDPIPEFLRNLRSPKVDPRPAGAKLYRKIFKQVEVFKENNDTNTLEAELARYQPHVLHWSIGGSLRYVPMAALYDPTAKQYLVEKFQNVIFTRSRKERFLLSSRSWAQGVGLGTSIAYEGFPALPGVVEELALIFGDTEKAQNGLLSGRVFLDKSFTRQTLLSIPSLRPALVHIASHFKFQPGDSRNSFLLLGDGSRVSLFDMQQNLTMFAGVDLITLSACETAAQQSNSAGKEVDGFAELAQRLGANSVIATLWKISDGATVKLMADFYRLRMQNPEAPKSEILQRAQLNLLRGGLTTQLTGTRPRRVRGTDEESTIAPATLNHPYYWAAFVLYGSSR